MQPKTYAVIAAFFIMMCLVCSCSGRIGNLLPPGVSTSAQAFDLTNITPTNQTQQVQAEETYVFAYHNVTLVMNSTWNLVVNVTVAEEVTPKILALAVEPNQNLSLNVNLADSPPPNVPAQEQTLNFYLSIEPNVTLQFQAQFKLNINVTELSQELNRAIDQTGLTWMYWSTQTQQWVTVQSFLDENGYLTCSTTHFSMWTVAENSASPSPSPTQPAATPQPTATPIHTPQPTQAPTPTPHFTPTPTPPTPSPSIAPSQEPFPSSTPQATPTNPTQPSASPTPSPSPTNSPTTTTESTGNLIESWGLAAVAVAAAACVIACLVFVVRRANRNLSS